MDLCTVYNIFTIIILHLLYRCHIHKEMVRTLNIVQLVLPLSVQDMTIYVHMVAATSSARTEIRSVSDCNIIH